MTAPIVTPAIEITGPSQDAWEVSKPYRVRVGSYSWCYCSTEADAIDFARKSGQTEIELSPRMALDPTEQHEADEPLTADELYERSIGRAPTAGEVALADAYGSSSGET